MIKPAEIIPEKLDLVMRDEDFVVYHDGKPLETAGGKVFAHKNARVLKHILLKLTLNRGLPEGLNSAGIFVFLQDVILHGQDPVYEHFNHLFDHDYVVRARFGGEKIQIADQGQAIEYLADNQDVMNLVYWSNSVIMEGFRSFLLSLDGGENPEEIRKLVKKKYAELSDELKAGVNLLSMYHGNGLILPLLLVLQFITPSEYASSTLAVLTRGQGDNADNQNKRIAEKFAIQTVTFDARNPVGLVKNVHSESLKTLEFLRFFAYGQRKISVISELISMGESDQLEFKSTFRWDLRQEKKNPAIEHASLKTIAAFLNSEGGDLLIGVEDDGNILGVEMDKFPNDDKFLLHLWALIKSSMGQEVSPFIKTTLENIDGKTVCRVHCKPGPKPVFLRQKGFDESFYIRIGPSTGSLEISEALKYIAERFRD